MSLEQTYCSFKINDQLCAIEIACVEEVLSKFSVFHVPNSKETCIGLINLRGQVLPIFDITKDKREKSKAIIVNISNNRMALAVDELGDVINLTNSEKETFIPNLKDDALETENTFIEGKLKLNDQQIITILKHDQLINL